MQAHPLSNPAARTHISSPPSVAAGPGLAHDAGNLLAALHLYCDLLAVPGVLQPQHTHYARELRALAQRSSSLMERMMRRAEPAAAARSGPFDPVASLRGVEPLLRTMAGIEVQVCVTVGEAVPLLEVEGEAFERVLLNLFRNALNAIQHGRHGASVQVKLMTVPQLMGPARAVRLSVEDDGPGINLGEAMQFFSPQTAAKTGRVRLGHRIIHELVEQSGGLLSIRSGVGLGTSIEVEWPATNRSEASFALATAGELPC